MTTNQTPKYESNNTTTTPGLIPSTVQVEQSDDEFGTGVTVHPFWSGVDRPLGAGWLVKDAKMAARLERALLAGAVYSTTEVKVDVNGRTYVATTSRVMGRHMNADLRKLGF